MRCSNEQLVNDARTQKDERFRAALPRAMKGGFIRASVTRALSLRRTQDNDIKNCF